MLGYAVTVISSTSSEVGELMTDETDLLKRVAQLFIWPELRDHGFEPVEGRYVRPSPEVFQVVEIQRSARRSSSGGVQFRLNYGLLAVRIAEFRGLVRADLPQTDVQSCHFIQRAGPSGFEQAEWWELHSHADIPVVGSDVTSTIGSKLIPELDLFSSEQQLIALWLSGRGPGITEAQRLANLSVLLKLSGRKVELAQVLTRLRDLAVHSSTRGFVRAHLKRLEGYDS